MQKFKRVERGLGSMAPASSASRSCPCGRPESPAARHCSGTGAVRISSDRKKPAASCVNRAGLIRHAGGMQAHFGEGHGNVAASGEGSNPPPSLHQRVLGAAHLERSRASRRAWEPAGRHRRAFPLALCSSAHTSSFHFAPVGLRCGTARGDAAETGAEHARIGTFCDRPKRIWRVH